MKKGMTKSERVLRWIKRRGGARFSEIQRYVVEELHGRDWDERRPVVIPDEYVGQIVLDRKGPRRWRGYWADNLRRILPKFCELGEDKRYRVVKAIRPPFTRQTREEEIESHREACHPGIASCVNCS